MVNISSVTGPFTLVAIIFLPDNGISSDTLPDKSPENTESTRGKIGVADNVDEYSAL